MQRLNFPKAYPFRFKNSENKLFVFDVIRKKFVFLTPEEWVRQHVVHYFIEHKKYSRHYINVEKVVPINGSNKRYDIVVFNPDGSIFLLVECKKPDIVIDQSTFDQIARYNLTLNAEFLMVTNGINHYYCKMDYAAQKYHFLHDIP